jgi:hypothetical protein
MDHRLQRSLIAMAERDQQLLADLTTAGEMPAHEYHPQMRAVHEANATALRQVIDNHDWPGRRLVGDDGGEAAWLIAQHAVSDVTFMALCARKLGIAVDSGDAPGWQLAFLEDRIRTLTGRKQVYGTQFEVLNDGTVVPLPIEDPAGVDGRRAELGLNTVAERAAEISARRTQTGGAIGP